ncbi:hypothetical protein MRI28_19320 [Nocardiopsis dassonvillei]|uniref:hypothetical protein n=1 Tax=Nocardiopsis dassonvillei TaxID=2014 RepID=UPI0020103BC2|nr:hypothetical protein [Nocardiopsis dassonvillei]MCK9871761.1 hypothetical protein [Nocardiopsis dassonvillei]
MAGTVPLRLPRAAVFAAVCTGVSSTGHVLASGHAVSPFGLASGFVLVLAVAHGLFRSEQRLGPLVATTLWGQTALHLLFAVASPGGSASHGADHAAGSGTLAGAGVGADMLLAHAAAGVVCAWWLRQGERAAFALVDLVRSLFRRLLVLASAPAVPARRGPARLRGRTPLRHGVVLLFLRHVRILRGPPAAFLF